MFPRFAADIHVGDVIIAIDLDALAAGCKEVRHRSSQRIPSVTQHTGDSLTFIYGALVGYVGQEDFAVLDLPHRIDGIGRVIFYTHYLACGIAGRRIIVVHPYPELSVIGVPAVVVLGQGHAGYCSGVIVHKLKWEIYIICIIRFYLHSIDAQTGLRVPACACYPATALQVDTLVTGSRIVSNGGNQDGLVRRPTGGEYDVGDEPRANVVRIHVARPHVIPALIVGVIRNILPDAGRIPGNCAAEEPCAVQGGSTSTADGDVPLAARFGGHGKVSDYIEVNAAIFNFISIHESFPTVSGDKHMQVMGGCTIIPPPEGSSREVGGLRVSGDSHQLIYVIACIEQLLHCICDILPGGGAVGGLQQTVALGVGIHDSVDHFSIVSQGIINDIGTG